MNYIESSFAYPFVIGCSLFGIAWGIVNVIMVSSSSWTPSAIPAVPPFMVGVGRKL